LTLLLWLAVGSSCGLSGTLRIWYVDVLVPIEGVRVRHAEPFACVPPGGKGTSSRFGAPPDSPVPCTTRYLSLQYAASTCGKRPKTAASAAAVQRASDETEHERAFALRTCAA
jgi:hypothetical protein